MVDRVLRQKLERLLISPGEAQDLLAGVARLDRLGEETPTLLDEPKEAGEKALGPGGCRWGDKVSGFARWHVSSLQLTFATMVFVGSLGCGVLGNAHNGGSLCGYPISAGLISLREMAVSAHLGPLILLCDLDDLDTVAHVVEPGKGGRDLLKLVHKGQWVVGVQKRCQ